MFNYAGLAIPHLKQRGGGSIVLMSNLAATRGNNMIGVYAMAKAALAQLANSKLRVHVTLSGRGKCSPQAAQTPAERHHSMNWAQRLKRVFQIDISQCEQCGNKVKLIACIEDAATIHRILDYLDRKARGPPALQAQ